MSLQVHSHAAGKPGASGSYQPSGQIGLTLQLDPVVTHPLGDRVHQSRHSNVDQDEKFIGAENFVRFLVRVPYKVRRVARQEVVGLTCDRGRVHVSVVGIVAQVVSIGRVLVDTATFEGTRDGSRILVMREPSQSA